MNRQRLELLALQLEIFKDKIDNEAYEYARKAIKDAIKGLDYSLKKIDNSSIIELKNAAHNIGESAVTILLCMAKKNQIKNAKKLSVGGLLGKINPKEKKDIPQNIHYAFQLLQTYRNQGAHANNETPSDDEVLMLLQTLFIIFKWYLKKVKKSDFDFDNAIKEAKSKQYKQFFEMALVDGNVHPKERDLLKKKAEELGLDVENIKHSEEKIEHKYTKTDGGLDFYQVMYSGEIYSAIQKLKEIIKKEFEAEGKVNCLNIALDMEVTWPFFSDFFEFDKDLKNSTYKGLIISPTLKTKRLSPSWRTNINHQIEKYVNFLIKNSDMLNQRDISIKVRKNLTLPVIHGILVNDKHLIWSFIDLDDNGHIQGGNKSYLYNTSSNQIGAYYIKVFKDLFNIFWEEGKEIEITKEINTSK